QVVGSGNRDFGEPSARSGGARQVAAPGARGAVAGATSRPDCRRRLRPGGLTSAWRFSSRIAALARRPSGRFADFSEIGVHTCLCLKLVRRRGAGCALWLAPSSIGSIYARPEARAAVMAAIGICYTLLAVRELWHGRGDGARRWPIIGLLLAHAASIPIHIPVAGAWKHPDPADMDLLTFMIFEAAFVSICAAYLFGSLVNDRIAAGYECASLTDPLTGVTNRRGFFRMGERLLMRTRLANQPAALGMFDLDRFKTINDKFGHGTGDEVLVAFWRLATAQLRVNDLFGRIGGEEFAS